MSTTRGTTRSANRPRYMKIETKPFFVTSGFAFFALMSLAVLIPAAVDDSTDARTFWYLECR